MAGDVVIEAEWRMPSARVALDPDEVHVWRVPLPQPREHIAMLARTLSDDERDRAARFYFDRDRTAFIAARGVLRALIGRYVDHAPDAVVFGYRDRGKPYLAAPEVGLCFNLSHSGELALLAFTRSREVGIDIELRRPLDDLRALADISFSRHEYATLCSLSPGDQAEAFFACWARKEAFIKATGEGVSQLAAFDVTLRPGEPARLLRIDGESPAQPRWSMHDLPAISGYSAALVVEGTPIRIACWDWMAPAALVAR